MIIKNRENEIFKCKFARSELLKNLYQHYIQIKLITEIVLSNQNLQHNNILNRIQDAILNIYNFNYSVR